MIRLEYITGIVRAAQADFRKTSMLVEVGSGHDFFENSKKR